MSVIGIALIIVFLTFTALMYLKRISAMLALPIMALLLAMVANVPREYILQEVVENGAMRLGPAIMAILFGGMLAMLIKNQGIAAVFVRYAAELGGDRPLAVAISLLIATGLLFTSLSGLGAVIMVGTIILPIMINLGISPLAAAGVMLIGIAMGGSLNISNWQIYISVLGLPKTTVRDFALVMAILYLIVGLIFCLWSLRRSQLTRFWPVPAEPQPQVRRVALLTPVVPLLLVLLADWPIVPAFVAGLVFALLAANAESEMALISLAILFFNLWLFEKLAPGGLKRFMAPEISFRNAIIGGLAASILFWVWEGFALVEAFRKRRSKTWKLALLTPFVTLILLHFFRWPMVSGMFAGALLALVITVRRETIQTFTKSLLESFESVGPAVILMVGIGMLLSSVYHDQIKNALQPFLSALAPRNGLLFVVVFTLLAPLALYRGPLNLWGMGTGVASILLATGALKPEVIMAMLLSVGALQSVCDPTNTYNVWIANFTKVDTVEILKSTIVYMWPIALVALSVAAVLYF